MKKTKLFCFVILILLVGCDRSQENSSNNKNTSPLSSSSLSTLEPVPPTPEVTTRTPAPINSKNTSSISSSSQPTIKPASPTPEIVTPNSTPTPKPTLTPVPSPTPRSSSAPSPSPIPKHLKKSNPNTDENAYPKVPSSVNRVPADDGNIYFKNSMLKGKIGIYLADGSWMSYEIEEAQAEEFLSTLQLEQLILSDPIDNLTMGDMSCGYFVRIIGADMKMIAIYEEHSQALFSDTNGEETYYNVPEGTYERIHQAALDFPDKKNVK